MKQTNRPNRQVGPDRQATGSVASHRSKAPDRGPIETGEQHRAEITGNRSNEPSGQRPTPTQPPNDLIGSIVPEPASAWNQAARRNRRESLAVALNRWRHAPQPIVVACVFAVLLGLGWVGGWHSSDIIEYLQNWKQRPRDDAACLADKRPWTVAQARAYLLQTANPSYTMTKQGPEFAINRLHPEFAIRLAQALREARDSGLSSAGIYSAYRPPAFGVGGFSDKFSSLHAYGLAVDLYGIGRPGSDEARRWYELAANHGVICPYGPYHKTEWNHCQPTAVKIIASENRLRETITANGPVSVEAMFEAGNSVLESLTTATDGTQQAQAAVLTAQASRTCANSVAVLNYTGTITEEGPLLYGLLPGEFSLKDNSGQRT